MSLVERLIPDVVHLLGVVTGLIMTAIVLAILCSRRADAVRHGIWLCALIATLLSPLAIVAAGRAGLRVATISVPWSARTSSPIIPETTLPRPIPEQAEPQPVLSSEVQIASRSFTNLDEVTPPDPLTLGQETRSVNNLSNAVPVHSLPLSAQESDPARPARVQKTDWPTALGRAGMMTWGVGVLILLARFLCGLFLLRVLRRSARLADESGLHQTLEQARSRLGVDRLPPIAVSPKLTSPVAVGVIRPLVILPEGLIDRFSPSSLGDVLVHESAHILRHDPLVGLLQRLAEMFYWPHPLVHLLNRRLARAREEICDNHVLKQGDPCEFARTLLALAERSPTARRPLGSLPLLNARWKLEDRVAGLLDPRRKPMTRMSRRNLACIAVLMIATGAALAGVRIEDSDRTAALEAEVESAAPSPPAELPVVDHPRRITGTVIDAEHGKPFENATVRLFRDWKTAGSVTTGTLRR